MDVAQEMIQRLGANGVSYQHISNIVGIQKASIHYHFPTKEKLLEELLDRHSSYFLGLVDGIIASGSSAEVKLDRYMVLFQSTLKEGKQDKACLCGMLGAELATLGLPSVKRIRKFYWENEKRLTKILEEGKNAGIFGFSGQPDTMAALIFSLLEGAALIMRAEGGPKKFKSVCDQLMKLVKK